MLKNIVAPVQAWLLSQNRCVGCGVPLSQGIKTKSKNKELITCKCRRVYIFNSVGKKYRRALVTELQ
jgi:hypothetical protein